MRKRSTLSLFALLACGPTNPPGDLSSTTDDTTSSTTSSSSSPATTTTLPDPTTSTTSITTTTTTAEPTTTEPTNFVGRPDLPQSHIQCDVFAQDCDPGQKCVPWANDGGGSWNATRCVDITGDGAPGDPCTAPEGPVAGLDDCALGGLCWDLDENNQGTCVPLCTGSLDAPVCPPQTQCLLTSEGIINICLSVCDPLLQDCPDDQLCLPDGDSFTCVIDGSGDAGQVNDPCEFADACDKGLVCLDPALASSNCDPKANGCCQPFCEFPGSPCPNPDQQCVQWLESETIGVCAIPP